MPAKPGSDQPSAYPNNITFHALIKKNKRDSTLLMILMIVLALVFGGIVGGAVAPIYWGVGDSVSAVGESYTDLLEQAENIDRPTTSVDANADRLTRTPARALGIDLSVFTESGTLLPGILIGAGIMGVIAAFGALWSWHSGSNAILRMSHARQITKELDAELFNVTEEMAIAAGIPMPKLYLIGDSAMNAFATGRDPQHGVVAITTGLRAKLSRDELQAVIAHEIAHIRHYDIRFSMLMATMVGILVVASDTFLRGVWYSGGAAARGSRRGGGKGSGPIVILLFVLAIILAIVTPILARIIQMSYSREREYLADAGAVELTRNPKGLASALSKLANDPDPLVDTANRGVAHMYIVNPMKKMHDSHQSLNSMFCSHPPLRKRVTRILALLR